VPGIEPGALVLPATLVAVDGTNHATDAQRRQTLAGLLARSLTVESGALAEAPQVLADPAAKRSLHERTGAVACDMESAAIAAVAAAHGLPFVAIRAIVDDAGMALPPVARAAMDSDGRLQPLRLTTALAGRPGAVHAQLRSLKNLAVAYRAARMALGEAAEWLAPAA
jgi:hypothetical protein